MQAPPERPRAESAAPALTFRAVLAESLLVLAGLVVLVAGFFYDVVFLGKTLRVSQTTSTVLEEGHYRYGGEELRSQSVYDNTPAVLEEPYLEFKRACFAQGVFPLWNPHQGGGYPCLAAMEMSPLYLPEVLLYLVPEPWSWDVYLLARLVLAGFFTYWLGRVLGWTRLACWAAALAFQFSGPLVGWVTNVTLNADVLLPALLLGVELVLQRRTAWPRIFLAIVAAQVVLGGHPEHAFLALLVAGLFALLRIAQLGAGGRGAPLGRLVPSLALGAALSAVQLIPALEYLFLRSWHAHGGHSGLEHEELRYLVTLVFPRYRSSEFVSFSESHQTWAGGWLGFVPLVLIGLASVARGADRTRYFVVGLLALCVLKVFGLRPAHWLGHLPVLELVRFQLHLPPAIAFLCALAIGQAVTALEREAANVRRLYGVFALVALGLGAALAVWPPPNGWLAATGVVLALAGGLAVVGGLRATSVIGQRQLALAVVALLGVESFSNIPRERADRGLAFQEPPFVAFLEAQPERGRVYGLSGVLSPNTATALGLDDLGMYEGLFVERFARYVHDLVDPGFFGPGCFPVLRYGVQDPANPFLDLLNVRYFLTLGRIGVSAQQAAELGLELVYDQEIKIFRRKNALPRAMIRRRVDVVPDDERALGLLKGGYDFRARVLLDRLPAGVELADAGEDASRVEEIGEGINSETVRVDMEHEGVLVLSDVFYPGWRVEIDGEEAELLRANYLFRAVVVPAGKHVVRFEFRPTSFVVGLVVSVSALVGLGVVAVCGRRASASV